MQYCRVYPNESTIYQKLPKIVWDVDDNYTDNWYSWLWFIRAISTVLKL